MTPSNETNRLSPSDAPTVNLHEHFFRNTPGRAATSYICLDGSHVDVGTLDHDEAACLTRLLASHSASPAWHQFKVHALSDVMALYDGRLLPRQETVRAPLYRVAADLASRLMVRDGFAAAPVGAGPAEKTAPGSQASPATFAALTGSPEPDQPTESE